MDQGFLSSPPHSRTRLYWPRMSGCQGNQIRESDTVTNARLFQAEQAGLAEGRGMGSSNRITSGEGGWVVVTGRITGRGGGGLDGLDCTVLTEKRSVSFGYSLSDLTMCLIFFNIFPRLNLH